MQTDILKNCSEERIAMMKSLPEAEVRTGPGWRRIDVKGMRYVEAEDLSARMLFRESDGLTLKWGRRIEDNPTHFDWGPEIADVELTKRCAGIRGVDGVRRVCAFCYKENVPGNLRPFMSLDVFKQVLARLQESPSLTQIAFGTDASLSEDANPDYWKIFDWCRGQGVTPNVTVADIDAGTAEKLARVMGACAVSYYPDIDKERCYDSVDLLVKAAEKAGREMKVNIHAMVSNETYPGILKLLEDRKSDSRLAKVNAIVFLSLKRKGRGTCCSCMPPEKFKELVDKCLESGIGFGFDSCSGPKFLAAVKGRPDYAELEQMCEPCESGLFSMFVDCLGNFYPCSFIEGEGAWKQGIDLKAVKPGKFVQDVWNSFKTIGWRHAALRRIECDGCNSCPVWDV